MHFVSLMHPATARQQLLYEISHPDIGFHLLVLAAGTSACARKCCIMQQCLRKPRMHRTLELCGAAGVVAAHQDRALAAAESPLPLGTRASRLLQPPSPRLHCIGRTT